MAALPDYRTYLKSKYSPGNLYRLFALCAFPIHAWTLILVFMDFSWVAERTRLWDAFGLVSYALLIALLETAAVFFVILLLDLLLPEKWGSDRNIALLGTSFLVTVLWGMLGQGYFLAQKPMPELLFELLANAEHPMWIIMGVLLPTLFLSSFVPLFLILKYNHIKESVIRFFDRIIILSSFYLIFDFLGIIIIIIRGVTS